MDNHAPTDAYRAGTTTADVSLAPAYTCRKCSTPIDVTCTFCSHCGVRQKTGDAWYYHPLWIAVIALTLIGPFALPLVWKSTRMGIILKLLMTALILAYTGYLGYIFYKVLLFEITTLNQVNEVMRHIR